MSHKNHLIKPKGFTVRLIGDQHCRGQQGGCKSTNIINALKKDGSGKSFFKDSVFQGLKNQIETNRDLNAKLFQSEEIDKAIQVCVESLARVNDIDSLRDKGDIGKTKRAKVTQDMEKAKSILNQNTLGKIFSGVGLEEGK